MGSRVEELQMTDQFDEYEASAFPSAHLAIGFLLQT
jgi:hypothetical protein